MSVIKKIQFHFHKNTSEALESTWAAMGLSPDDINQVHVVYGSYLQNSIKESERAHTSVIPVNLKSFWFSASNKHQCQVA